ncbi:MAG: hypothetical protein QXT53_02840 [Ignisphaera sp.]
MKSPYAQSDVLCLRQGSCCVTLDDVSRIVDTITRIVYIIKSPRLGDDWIFQEMKTIRNVALNIRSSLDSFTKNIHRIAVDDSNKELLIHTATNILNRFVELRNRLSVLIDHVKNVGNDGKILTELSNLLSNVNSIAIKLVIVFLSLSTKIKWSKELIGPFSAAMASSILATLLDMDRQVAQAIDECLYL